MDKIKYFIKTQLPWFSIPDNIEITSIIEIAILALIFYTIYSWIKNKKVFVLLKGILLIISFYIISYICNFYVFLWFFENAFQALIICVAVVFQPELRKILEAIGQSKFKIFQKKKNLKEKYTDKTIDEIIKAVKTMSKYKTGALILIEQENSLTDYEQTGIFLNADISSQLLINIFEHNTPLHDGALIIKNNKISSATCYLPLSDNNTISKDLGTRHRAALGASEVCDAVIIVVSEETGKISLAINGSLETGITLERLKEILKTYK